MNNQRTKQHPDITSGQTAQFVPNILLKAHTHDRS